MQSAAVKEGVDQAAGATGILIACEDAPARWPELVEADAIIFGAPTYMAGVSAEFKAFEEVTSNAIMARGFLWKDKIAAGFTNSGAHAGDKLATLVQIALFAAQHGMHWVSLGLPPRE